MRAIHAVSGILLGAGILAGATYPAAADTTTSTSGAGASVSIVSGSNGGVTIFVDSQHPCRAQTVAGLVNHESGTSGSSNSTGSSGSSSSTSVGTGAGGLSGSATAGSGGTSVNINPGGGGTSSSASSGKNVAGANECVVIIKGPAPKK